MENNTFFDHGAVVLAQDGPDTNVSTRTPASTLPQKHGSQHSRRTSSGIGPLGQFRSGSSGAGQSHNRQHSVDLRTYSQMYYEHQYLVASLGRQDDRIRRLLGAMSAAQAQLQAAQGSAEARKYRKNVGFVKSKIAEAEQQERLVLLRLGDVWSDMQRLSRVSHLQHYQRQEQVQTSAGLLSALSRGSRTGNGAEEPTIIREAHMAAAEPLLGPMFVVSPISPGMALPPCPPTPSALAPLNNFVGSPLSPMSPLAEPFYPRFQCFESAAIVSPGTTGAGGSSFLAQVPASTSQLGEDDAETLGSVETQDAHEGAGTECDSRDAPLAQGHASSGARRGSFDATPLCREREKRMSLPAERLAWPEESA